MGPVGLWIRFGLMLRAGNAAGWFMLEDRDVAGQVFADNFWRPWALGGLWQRPEDGDEWVRQCDEAVYFDGTLILIEVVDAAQGPALREGVRRLVQLGRQIGRQWLYAGQASEPWNVLPARVFRVLVCLHSTEALALGRARDRHPVLLYSLTDWQQVMGSLDGWPDWLDWLSAHERAVQSPGEDWSVRRLLSNYVAQGRPFDWALQHEHQWLQQGLKRQPSPLLRLGLEQPHLAWQQARLLAQHWQALVGQFQRQSGPQADPATRRLLDLLAGESIVSAAHLGQAMQSPAALSAAQQGAGYLIHLRSHAHPQRHYLLVFYATAADHAQGREALLPQLPQLAEQINAQQQAPLLDDILVLGLQVQGGATTRVDVAHLSGHRLQLPQLTNALPTRSDWVNLPSAPHWPVGRNERCPCGSGRRYKQCCGQA